MCLVDVRQGAPEKTGQKLKARQLQNGARKDDRFSTKTETQTNNGLTIQTFVSSFVLMKQSGCCCSKARRVALLYEVVRESRLQSCCHKGQLDSSTLVAVPVLLLLTSLTYLYRLQAFAQVGSQGAHVPVCECVSMCVWGVKRSFSQNVPSPVAFFQSLYSVHNGDFQGPTEPVCCRAKTAPVPHEEPQSLVSGGHCVADLGPNGSLVVRGPGGRAGGPWHRPPRGCAAGGRVVQGAHPPAYLPQEVWVSVSPTCHLPHTQIAAVVTTGPWAALGGGTPPPSQETHGALGPAPLWPVTFPGTSRAWMPGKEVVLWESVTVRGRSPLHGSREDLRAFSSLLRFAATRFNLEP
ncbi:hypothetical protein PANDA_015862 [Ailuropoda melanoleuca]|uniref:Uncharacterized protein n=1 Tax=Ailuropoda melanoleuca TaxID=9646 RepID=D2HUC4_AILME|nr:hypothetical protein PANDA_015862 [Ailuropoda melanoleuca]